MAISLFDTAKSLEPLRDELREAVLRVVDSGRFVLGPEVQEFERELADYVGTSGRSASVTGPMRSRSRCARSTSGPATMSSCPRSRFTRAPRRSDRLAPGPCSATSTRETFCVTPETVRAALTPNTKAVIAVHLFGNVAPVAEIAALGVPVVEDAAQALGTKSAGGRPGSLGTIATFSFYPSKNLGAFGDGGAITTSDAALAQRVRSLRFHGSRDKVTFDEIGYNSRLDAIQAAVLRVQLPHLDRWSDGRRAAVGHYERAGLAELVTLPQAAAGVDPAWHLYVVRTPDPDSLAEALGAGGIESRSYYQAATHQQPAMREFAPNTPLPGTETACASNLAIPISAVLSEAQAEEVVAAARAHLESTALAAGGTGPN